ncbi:hypothetical protein ACB092_01G136800 [Castanea dentata]
MWHIAFSTLALLRFEESVLGAAQNFPLVRFHIFFQL